MWSKRNRHWASPYLIMNSNSDVASNNNVHKFSSISIRDVFRDWGGVLDLISDILDAMDPLRSRERMACPGSLRMIRAFGLLIRDVIRLER